MIALPRSYHCNVCQRCVERYDHHCPWINTCIGTQNHASFLLFVTFQTTYIIAVLVQICAFYVSFARAHDSMPATSGVSQVYHALTSTCFTEQQHFADLCTPAFTEGGYFANSETEANHFIVFTGMTFLFLLASPFLFGLVTLWLIQMKNFCTGMTTLERLGSAQHRTRNFAFVEHIREVTDHDDDDYCTGDGQPQQVTVEPLEAQHDSFMRFEGRAGEDDELVGKLETPGNISSSRTIMHSSSQSAAVSSPDLAESLLHSLEIQRMAPGNCVRNCGAMCSNHADVLT